MSEVKTNKVSPVGANGTVSLGDSGDTFTMPSGVPDTMFAASNVFDSLISSLGQYQDI